MGLTGAGLRGRMVGLARMGRTSPTGRDWRLPRRVSQARSISKSATRGKLTHADKLAFISQYERVPDPTNTRAVSRQYGKLKSFPLYLQKSATKEQRAILKERGFFTTGKGVIVDGPRTAKRKPIAGTRFAILKDGTVTFSKGSRKDYIVGFTRAEKKAFAKDPKKFMDAREKEFRAKLKARGIKARDVQIRLQWGAYQGTKDFAPNQFMKRYPYIESKVKGQAILDRMTGMHVVIHVAKKKKRSKGK